MQAATGVGAVDAGGSSGQHDVYGAGAWRPRGVCYISLP
jgi:hypothetical protein